MMITLAGSMPPAQQICDQVRGLIASGELAAEDRLPSVRQLAKDLAVAPGTVAKAYRTLEAERLVTARIGGGTRVSSAAAATPRTVLNAARDLATAGSEAGLNIDDAIRLLRAIWPKLPESDTENPSKNA
ncbi:DNA-binding transcriptional regulator YhcF (GntR family) [Microbacterium halimionae]|uniref:DNA-binding transcriptional regulator YhcF (GntR family) n=1 Tax=Microbacterium halimionae TaxID=1526413 RepID=A0A7W3JR82_9MICO|nr:GntR family transcriptional regulator [Microbacterium halimionae]MBA8817522.1 DNA-binding transcriptional regulator YhcF (GntR family) [Microbacterium halimionae]NII95035.1 DNA-binding transcriptional regulator YhcF (GntR family) [Microbacterium halimionae]